MPHDYKADRERLEAGLDKKNGGSLAYDVALEESLCRLQQRAGAYLFMQFIILKMFYRVNFTVFDLEVWLEEFEKVYPVIGEPGFLEERKL